MRAALKVLHLISGKIFWISSVSLPLPHPLRRFIEAGLLRFYRWEIRLDPSLSDGYSKIGSLLANLGQPDEAVKFYRKALQSGHDHPAKIQYFMGRQKAQLGDNQGALECYKDFVSLAAQARGVPAGLVESWSQLQSDPEFDPNRFHGYAYLAEKCIGNGFDSIGLDLLNASITLEPLVVRAHSLKAELLYRSGKRRESRKATGLAHKAEFRFRQTHLGIPMSAGKRVNQPDFMILGKKKCGTSSLYSYLTGHPRVVPATTKELKFFTRHYDRGLDWYLEQFPPIAGRTHLITGEASPDYIDSYLAAERIKKSFPDMRFIVLLRDPVERTISHYKMHLRESHEDPNLERDLLSGIEPMVGDRRPSQFVECSIYLKMLRLWMSLFSRDQFMVLRSEDLFAAPAQVTERVFAFLGQPPNPGGSYPVINPGHRLNLDGAVRARLRKFFLPHNLALEEYLGMKFGWND